MGRVAPPHVGGEATSLRWGMHACVGAAGEAAIRLREAVTAARGGARDIVSERQPIPFGVVCRLVWQNESAAWIRRGVVWLGKHGVEGRVGWRFRACEHARDAVAVCRHSPFMLDAGTITTRRNALAYQHLGANVRSVLSL